MLPDLELVFLTSYIMDPLQTKMIECLITFLRNVSTDTKASPSQILLTIDNTYIVDSNQRMFSIYFSISFRQ